VIGIYKITNKINNKCYVGQSDNIKRRWKDHKKDAFWQNGDCYEYPLYRAIRKYGVENFYFEVLEECPFDKLNEREIYYIALYQSNNREFGYNQNEGGQLNSHSCKLTVGEVDQIIRRLKTTFDTAEVICKDFGISATTIRDINRGDKYHKDDEVYPIRPKLQKLRDYQDQLHPRSSKEQDNLSGKIKINTQELAQARKYYCPKCGKEISYGAKMCVDCYRKSTRKSERPEPLSLAKMIIENGFAQVGKYFGVNGNTIKKWCKDYSIPHKKQELIDWYNIKMGIVVIQRKRTSISEIVKPINQIDQITGKIIQTFSSCEAAARAIGAQRGDNIGRVCRGLRKSAYGYYWQYA
jgi:predicted RNA-binding Zn-ribbon protein involved in translation (DUF1610 family)